MAEGETSAASVIRYYAPMLDAERHAPQWRLAQHLIKRVGNLLTPEESRRLLDTVIQHVQLMVGDAAAEIMKFDFLADGSPEEAPAIELFRMIVWLCDHPEGLRRDRAAAMLLWLFDQLPELHALAIKSAFSMEEGYGPDVLCGVLDGASIRNPISVWDEVAATLDIAAIAAKLNHLSRRVVLLRLAARAGDAGSGSAKRAAQEVRQNFTGKRREGDAPALPPFAMALAPEWRRLETLVDKDGVLAWAKMTEQVCAPLNIADARSVEESVSTCFRQHRNRPFNRWESKLRYALNVALCGHASANDSEDIEAILRIYNPSQSAEPYNPNRIQ